MSFDALSFPLDEDEAPSVESFEQREDRLAELLRAIYYSEALEAWYDLEEELESTFQELGLQL